MRIIRFRAIGLVLLLSKLNGALATHCPTHKTLVMKKFLTVSVTCLLIAVMSACAPHGAQLSKPKSAEFAVALAEPHAADAVADVLRSGGNAVDAAVTAAFTLAVTYPQAGNIGGGGFMLAHINGKSHFLDYRETAPAAATRDIYIEPDGTVKPRSSLIGVRAAGTPGTVAGLWEAHQKFGSKPWAELLAPAIQLAAEGFQVHPKIAGEIPSNVEWFGADVNFKQYFGAMEQGGVFKQPELAATLARISALGPDDFYRGETADLIVAEMQRQGGLLSADDLASYTPVWRQPLSAEWRGYQIVSAPPPSSGGFAVIHLLQMKQALAEQFTGLAHNSAQYVHLIAEMEKRVFADRAEYFGDPDFVSIPMQRIMDRAYIRSRAAAVNSDTISPTPDVKPGIDSPNTTHFSIIDPWGNAVSNTYTLNWGYGSGAVVEGAGFILNNEMDDFSVKPGVPNVYGVVGGVANEIAPQKRMLSSMSPTLVLKDNEVEVAVGAMGGSTIFTSVFQVIVNLLEFDMSPYDSVDASRFHHQLLPKDLITTSISRPLPSAVQTTLQERGYRVQPHDFEFGNLQVITRRDGKLMAASDPRNIGKSIVETTP